MAMTKAIPSFHSTTVYLCLLMNSDLNDLKGKEAYRAPEKNLSRALLG